MKKTLIAATGLALVYVSCATYQPPPPSFYLDDLPPFFVTQLSLDERIITEEAWKSLRAGNAKKAQKDFAKLGSQSPFYEVGLGFSAYLLEDLVGAEQYFRASSQKHPDLVLSHVGLAQIYLETGREDDAFTQLREILKQEPQHPWAYPRYENIKIKRTQESIAEAKSFWTAGNKEMSKQSFLRALYYSPNSIDAHLSLANIFRLERNYSSAQVHLQAAMSIDAENVEVQKLYADTLFQTEEYKKSLEVYERLQSRLPDDRTIRERLETIKNRLGIFELPDQYDAIPGLEAMTKEDVAALIGVKFKGILDEPSQTPPIIIDIATSWASKYIIQIASEGIMDVYPNHTFQPKKLMTRGDMADVLFRLIDYLKLRGYSFIQQIPPERIQISDILADNFYFQPIVQLISYDIMDLFSDRTFRPDIPVSGREAIKYVDILLMLIK